MEVVVSKGFLLFAQNTDSVDYVKQAYALALSIKNTQNFIKNVSLVTNSKIPKKYSKVFDQIIPIPYFKKIKNSPLQAEHRYQLYNASPYDETIVLDSDMLMSNDISGWWDYCSNYDIHFCNRVTNYKLETITDTVHRKTFIANELPNVYYALHYFKKSEKAQEFFKVLEFVVNNWQACYGKFAPMEYQNWVSMDVSAAIAIKLSGMEEVATTSTNPMNFTHMKSAIQGWPIIPDSWQTAVPCILDKRGNLIVGNIRQNELFHYVEKNFVNEKILAKLEGLIDDRN
jgi:hypothetical protein